MAARLTNKQASFVAEYLVDLNATQAAIRAGYSEKTAYSMGQRLLKNVEIQKALETAQKARGARLGRQSADVLEDIISITREARAAGDFKTALKGLELEGRHLGMFKDRLETEISGGLQIKWQQ